MAKRLLIALVVLILAGVGVFVALQLWLSSGDAPDAFEVSDVIGTTTTVGEATSTAAPATTAAPDAAPAADLTGDWVVDVALPDGMGVGYRILEDVPIGGPETIVARSVTPTGSLSVDGVTVTAAEVAIDIGDLASDNDVRDQFVAKDYLGAEEHPTATFTLGGPIALEIPATPGEVASIETEGTLTINGVSQTVPASVQGQWGENRIEIVGTVDITLSQFDVDRPDLAGRTARDEAVIEFKIQFVPA